MKTARTWRRSRGGWPSSGGNAGLWHATESSPSCRLLLPRRPRRSYRPAAGAAGTAGMPGRRHRLCALFRRSRSSRRAVWRSCPWYITCPRGGSFLVSFVEVFLACFRLAELAVAGRFGSVLGIVTIGEVVDARQRFEIRAGTQHSQSVTATLSHRAAVGRPISTAVARDNGPRPLTLACNIDCAVTSTRFRPGNLGIGRSVTGSAVRHCAQMRGVAFGGRSGPSQRWMRRAKIWGIAAKTTQSRSGWVHNRSRLGRDLAASCEFWHWGAPVEVVVDLTFFCFLGFPGPPCICI